MADKKLNLNINLCEIRYLGVPDVIDSVLDWGIWNNVSNRLDEIQYVEVIAAADRKIRDVKIP